MSGISISWARIGAALVAAGISLGAFGAHGLRGKIPPELLKAFETGVLYHVLHAFAIMLLGIVRPGSARALRLMLLGVILFSGSLYLLAVTGVRAFGMITPLGGLAFIAAWIVLALDRKF